MQPDNSPVPDYFFQFTTEEVMLCPGIETRLVPPHKAAVAAMRPVPVATDESCATQGNVIEDEAMLAAATGGAV